MTGVGRLRVVPAADGGGGLLEAVVMSARRHPRFTDHVGLTALGGKSVAGLAWGWPRRWVSWWLRVMRWWRAGWPGLV